MITLALALAGISAAVAMVGMGVGGAVTEVKNADGLWKLSVPHQCRTGAYGWAAQHQYTQRLRAAVFSPYGRWFDVQVDRSADGYWLPNAGPWPLFPASKES